MKTKTLSFVLLTAFLVLTSLALVSAAVTFSLSAPSPFSDSTSSQTLTISNPSTSGEALNFAIPSYVSISDGTNSITITPNVTSIANLGNGTSTQIALTRGIVPTAFTLGAYSNVLSITGTNATGTLTQNATLTFIRTLCSNGTYNATGLDFEMEVSNLGDGEDNEWKLLDEIEVDLTFDNNKNVDLDSVYFELGLVDASGTDVSEDLLWSSEDEDKIKMGDVDDEDSAEHTFSFKVPNTLDDGTYLLMLRAYTKDNSVCADAVEGFDSAYSSLAKSISVVREDEESRQIVIEDISFDADSTICGGEATLTAKAYNIGEDDQKAVKIYLANKELGLNLEKLITNFDMNDDAKNIEFSFAIPKNATAKTYLLNLYSIYDYDRDDDEDKVYPTSAFGQNSDVVTANLVVTCGTPIAASITADFSEETPTAVIGSQVIIEATIKNTGTSSATYDIEIAGNSEWSTLAEIDPKTITLAAGESKLVSIYLDIDSDATEGAKEFTIKAKSGTTTLEQKVSVEVEKGLSGQALANHFKKNWFIYAIVLVNLILIIAIIIAVRSIMKKN